MNLRACAIVLATASLAACAGDSGSNRPASTPSAAMPSRAEQACLAAVSRETNQGDVTLVRSEISEGTGLTAVYVDVGEARAPWGCYATADGRVESVQFLGDEGAL